MNGIITRGTLNPRISARIAELEGMIKVMKQEQDALKNAVLTAMEANGIVKIDTPEVMINYIAEFDKETFDTKKFKDENPGIYDVYCKMTPVKASLRIKVK